jgi:uncharacterized protein (TIGR00251 family)
MVEPRSRRPEPGAETLDIREGPEGTTFRVRVQPRASRDGFGGKREGMVVVRLTAPPVEGAANRALTRFLGRALGVAPTAVTVVSGAGGRSKRVAVAGIDAATARDRLERWMES